MTNTRPNRSTRAPTAVPHRPVPRTRPLRPSPPNFTPAIETDSVDNKTPAPRRIYLGGLTDPVTPTEVESRFRAFGTVSAIAIPASASGAPRGWKGGTLAVSRATRDPVAQREEEREASRARAPPNTNRVFSLEPPKPAAALPRGVVPGAVSVRAAKPVTDADDSADLGRLWKRSRMGRAVALMRRMHQPGVGRVTIDPSVYRACLEPLYVNPRPTRVQDLTWSLECREEGRRGRGEEMEAVDWWEQKGVEEDEEGESGLEGEGEEGGSSEAEGEEGEDELAAGSDVAASAPSSSDSDDSASSDDDDENAMDVDDEEEPAPSAPARAQQLDIFSDEEVNSDEEADRFAVKGQFEGESGRELLALQAKARGDDRFKLTADFAADGSDDSDASSSASDTAEPTAQDDADEEDDEAIGNLAKERDMAMSLLSSMFGEEAVQESVKKRAHANVATNAPSAAAKDNALARTYQLTGMAFYDPDAADHEAYEIQPEPEPEETVEVTADPFLSDAASDHDSESSASEDESDAEPAAAAAEEDDGKDKDQFGNTVRADFSAIFTRGGPSAEAQAFSLFNSAPSSDAKPSFSLFGNAAVPAPTPVVTSSSVFPGAALASTQFFISARLAALEAGTGKHFVRTADVAEIEATWRATRRDLAVETHRRAKNAARKAMRRKHGGLGGGQATRA
ncbi:hypothetical protein AMAG_06638 [Allomyces macrogynus ATCC 38327]|uniref:RRM domain-containing protein n=1 Tax=Allomyces macrogynus (strain ATCC 38327) TaxID=578462 RepID=A0A0L0SEK3_ALLM3|nr:hypothetical protein AMAG_06638 [Allomyces macrogynus ATCC 38327]|eukprot:KNE60877.1 hypothetical protein AMAG_06638 [Allomyces macrogynus ATCC 38327]